MRPLSTSNAARPQARPLRHRGHACPRPGRGGDPRRTRQAGFSLVEVLVALVVLALGLLGLAALQSNGLKATQSAHLRTLATHYAYDILDRMRANRDAARTGEYDLALDEDTPTCNPLAYDQKDCDLAQWRADLSSLPGGTGSIAFDAATQFVTVVVQWNDERAGGSASTRLTIQAQL